MASWSSYILAAHARMIETRNSKELGKLRANACEYLGLDYLKTLITENSIPNWSLVHVDDLDTMPLFLDTDLHKLAQLYNDKNKSGFDILLFDTISPLQNHIRIQVKYRNTDFHFETTRRNSKKNANNNDTGHVSYSPTEFDGVLGILMNNEMTDALPSQEKFVFIPTCELIHKKKPNTLVSRIPDKLVNTWREQTRPTLCQMMRCTSVT